MSLSDVQIDHIIPEHLNGSNELSSILVSLGRPEGFEINSFENWMPAHPICNRGKAGHVFSPSPLIQMELERASLLAGRAKDLAQRYATERQIDSAIQRILIAHEAGSLTNDQQKKLADVVLHFHEENRPAEMKGRSLMIAPWLTVLGEDAHYYYLQGPGGMRGIRPKGDKIDMSWDCPRCGVTGWNGVKCITCGMMDDGD